MLNVKNLPSLWSVYKWVKLGCGTVIRKVFEGVKLSNEFLSDLACLRMNCSQNWTKWLRMNCIQRIEEEGIPNSSKVQMKRTDERFKTLLKESNWIIYRFMDWCANYWEWTVPRIERSDWEWIACNVSKRKDFRILQRSKWRELMRELKH